MNYYYYNIIFSFFICFNLILTKSSSSNKYNNLISWIKNNGGYITNKISPEENNEYNRRMISTKEILKEELISFIPEKIVLSSINSHLNSLCRKAYGLFHKKDLECITLFITLDKKNKNSFFKPYYDYLPKFNIDIFPPEYSKEKLKLFDELEFELYVGISNNKLKKGYNDQVKLILKEKGINNPFEEFKYNYYLVKSRNFARPGSDFFFDLNSCVPFIELFNHDNNFNTDWGYDENKKGFFLKAIKDIKIGEELTISYGEEFNINLFMTYGFTLENNIYMNPIRVKIGKYQYSFYPSNNKENNIKGILNVHKSLKEIYGFEREKERFIYILMKQCFEKKLENIKLIKKDDINIKNIVDEIIINIEKYIKILNEFI